MLLRKLGRCREHTNQEAEPSIFLYMENIRRHIKNLMKRVEPRIEVIEVLPPQRMGKEATLETDPETDLAAMNGQEELRSH